MGIQCHLYSHIFFEIEVIQERTRRAVYHGSRLNTSSVSPLLDVKINRLIDVRSLQIFRKNDTIKTSPHGGYFDWRGAVDAYT